MHKFDYCLNNVWSFAANGLSSNNQSTESSAASSTGNLSLLFLKLFSYNNKVVKKVIKKTDAQIHGLISPIFSGKSSHGHGYTTDVITY